MNVNEFISYERKIELEKELEKEIQDFKNNIICRRKFIYYIRKYNFIESCYLYITYIGIAEEKSILQLLKYNNLEFITEPPDFHFDIPKRTMTYKIQDVKKIKRIENMALKGKRKIKRK